MDDGDFSGLSLVTYIYPATTIIKIIIRLTNFNIIFFNPLPCLSHILTTSAMYNYSNEGVAIYTDVILLFVSSSIISVRFTFELPYKIYSSTDDVYP